MPALGLSLAGKRLDFEPDFVFALVRPNGGHFGKCVAGNHDLKGRKMGKQPAARNTAVAFLAECGAGVRTRGLIAVCETGGDEALEERVWRVGLALKLRVILAGEEP